MNFFLKHNVYRSNAYNIYFGSFRNQNPPAIAARFCSHENVVYGKHSKNESQPNIVFIVVILMARRISQRHGALPSSIGYHALPTVTYREAKHMHLV